ncbi:hypothetical protein J5N97_021875 [Dioscorea zingiberensis]|uniref:CCAAT-binding factor domain-containing protein n=1 Tax=Dioscorea zingiberensis TaxID=325984 RepID=A0A9D5C9F9_9LILI|nr:hypothetical protein J5N97_021875 [Dioscorea zingiberensis]
MASVPEKQRAKTKKGKRKGETLTLDELRTLSHDLLSSRAHVNNLPVLLSFLSPSSPLDLALEALISLQSFFTPLIPDIPSSSGTSSNPLAPGAEDDAVSVYKVWLRARFDEFVNSLIEVTVSPQSAEELRDFSLDALMEFVKLGKEGKFQSAIYHRLLQNIIQSTSSVDTLLDMMMAKYFKYIDVCYFTYTSIDKIVQSYESSSMTDNGGVRSQTDGELSKSKVEVAAHIIFKILSHTPPIDTESTHEMWSQLGLSSKKTRRKSSKVLTTNGKPEKSKEENEEVPSFGHATKKIKLRFTKAWMSFLKLPLPFDVYKEVLVTLHQNVMPYMANPAVLCDFLTRSYDIGGVISVMALSGLFVLMTRHGLEYPKFYEKLYALLTPTIFMSKHRAVFFQLLDTCLKSAYLPAYLAAAFTKKLSRLSLSVPPSGALVIIAIIHNLLRRHPSINFLVHQVANNENGKDQSVNGSEPSDASVSYASQGEDFFDSEETDPAKSGAMRSSLWEIDTLRHHYCPAVSRFVASLENDLTVRAKTSEVTVGDFGSGSYATIFHQETRRRIKQVPLAFYKGIPTSLFWESDFPGWTFGKLETGHENAAVNSIEDEIQKTAKRLRVEC